MGAEFAPSAGVQLQATARRRRVGSVRPFSSSDESWPICVAALGEKCSLGMFGPVRLLPAFWFLPATWCRRNPIVDIQASRVGAQMRSSLHQEVRKYVLYRGGVELRRYERFPPPMNLGSYSRLLWRRRAVWDCLVSGCERICGIVQKGKTAIFSKWAVLWFPPRHFGKEVFKSRFSTFACRRIGA